MLEILLLGVPVAFSALVFGAALFTVPHDIVVQEITAPQALQFRGYHEDALAALLEDRIDAIVDGAASLHAPKGLDTGLHDEPINAFLETFGISQPVRATQKLLGMVDYVVEISIAAKEGPNLIVTVRITDDELNTIKLTELQGDLYQFDALWDRTANEIVAFTEPYIMAISAYNATSQQPLGSFDFDLLLSHLKNTMPVVRDSDRSWFYNFLGRIAAEETNDLDLAVEYYRRALASNPQFASALVNLGRVHHQRRDYAKAISHYRSALSAEPDLAIAHVYWAESALARGRFKEALAQLVHAQSVAPELARIYEVRAAILDHAGLAERAASERRRADLARIREPRQSFYDAV
jgi:tetratricopeptide (TPR) repeat protein